MTFRDHATTLSRVAGLGRVAAVAGAAVLAATVAVVATPAPAGAAAVPFGQPVTVGDARQLLTVKSRPGTSYATLSGWVLRDGRWVRNFGPTAARVGANGTTGSPREGRAATPRGTYTLTEAFGTTAAPAGTRLPYRRAWNAHWWVSDPRSRYYNTWQTGPPNGRWNPAYGEQLTRYRTAYAYSIVIDFNRSPVVRGKGSAIFLHVGTGGATAGCVSVSSARMAQLLRYLQPKLKPRIAIA
jgi:L,D-peptidoglycan transpeptidase YkuD (ErfK/YbiS/YcfS/YnhG family)